MLFKHTQILFDAQGVRQEEMDLVFDATETQYAELLVMAFIGRHLVEHVSSHKFIAEVPATFSYNVVTERLQIAQPSCAYEKTFYMGLLVVSVIVIILALGLRFWEHSRASDGVDEAVDTAEEAKPVQSSSSNMPDKAASRVTVRLGAAQSPDVRYRAIPQTAFSA